MGVGEGEDGKEEEGERMETKRTTKSIQIETGDITPISSVPRESSMLPSIAIGFVLTKREGAYKIKDTPLEIWRSWERGTAQIYKPYLPSCPIIFLCPSTTVVPA